MSTSKPICSFCGKGLEKVRKLIEGGRKPMARICDDCVLTCHDVFADMEDLPLRERRKWRESAESLRKHLTRPTVRKI